ncbi:glial cell line-derived neurotrophic factor isoform X3 [Chiloscyllium punctatum]|uniref:glial cell line-derived neurotrophic factor isoform X3 n=1 Tax=Chiloscyllium punctatum TaxID=137246 RepID=UPI003B63DFBC
MPGLTGSCPETKGCREDHSGSEGLSLSLFNALEKQFNILSHSEPDYNITDRDRAKDKNIFKTHNDEEAKELVRALIQRYRRSPDSKHKSRTYSRLALRSKRAKSRATKGCTLKEINVTVSDLGFAHVSEEVVRFRYCTGSCDAEEKNYDLTLKALRNSKRIKKDKVRARPCCRPTLYDDDVSFLDENFHYYTLRQLSAKECGCV